MSGKESDNMKEASTGALSSSRDVEAQALLPPPAPKSKTSQHFKLILLAMMVIQNSSTVLVGRYTRAGVPKEQLYEVNHLILVIESAKFLLALALEFVTTRGKLLQSIKTHVFDRPCDAAKILVPALLYLVQNTLLYVALTNLTAPIFQVTYQGKLVTTAIVSVIMLQRAYSVKQWICLVGISIGVAIVVLGEQAGSHKEDNNSNKDTSGNLVLGLVAVTVACLSSAFAGVYFEMVLKTKALAPGDDAKVVPVPSIWMRNIQLAFYSVIIAACRGMMEGGGDDSAGDAAASTIKPYLHGFGFWTWVLVALQAGGGMLVAAVIKYADNVLKGLATGVSVIVSSLLSVVFFSTELHPQFYKGAILILASVWFFSNPLPSFFTPRHSETTQ